jgi:hypothetical protein
MAESKSRHDWQLMSSLLAQLASCHSGEAHTSSEFDPWVFKDAPEIDIADVPLGG